MKLSHLSPKKFTVLTLLALTLVGCQEKEEEKFEQTGKQLDQQMESVKERAGKIKESAEDSDSATEEKQDENSIDESFESKGKYLDDKINAAKERAERLKTNLSDTLETLKQKSPKP